MPQSAGAIEASQAQGGANAGQRGDPRFDTADFNDRVAGNLRVDYLLPSKGLPVCSGGVFWPAQGEPAAALVWGRVLTASRTPDVLSTRWNKRQRRRCGIPARAREPLSLNLGFGARLRRG